MDNIVNYLFIYCYNSKSDCHIVRCVHSDAYVTTLAALSYFVIILD